MSLHTALIALGANLGDPVATLQAAFKALAQRTEWRVMASSSLYRTAPIGLADQPDFINAVVALETALHPDDVLATLFQIENDFGRIRREKDGPRTLDLDLLLYDELVCDTPHLTLPHPRMHQRAFVLVPLAEIAPDTHIPGHGPVTLLLPTVAKQLIHRV